MFIRLFVLFLLACMGMDAQSVRGSLTVDGKTFDLKHVCAFQQPDRVVEGAVASTVLVTDIEIPEKLRKPNPNPFELRDAGVSGIRFEFYNEGTNYMAALIGGGIRASLSVSGSMPESAFKLRQPDRVHVVMTRDKDELGSHWWAFSVEIDTEVLVYSAEPKYVPTQGDIDAARSSPVSKAYLAYHDAIRKGDLKTLEQMVVPERAATMKDPEFKEMFPIMQEMMAKDVKVLKVVQNGDEAELTLTGSMMGEANQRGIAKLTRIAGKWLVASEKWGDID